jgi:hypothetical protein
MDDLAGRIATLEHRVRTLEQQDNSTLCRLRWWRRLACTLAVLTMFSLPLSLSAGPEHRKGSDRNGDSSFHHKRKDDNDKAIAGLAQRIRTLERKLKHVTSELNEAGRPELVITGANLRIINGLGRTDCGTEDTPLEDCPNGLGNLIVGYDEERGSGDASIRTGSHNVVIGTQHNFSSFGGLVVGLLNTIAGRFSSVTGGSFNTAAGDFSSISGGQGTVEGGVALGRFSSISGGLSNRALGISRQYVAGSITRLAARQQRCQEEPATWPAGAPHRSPLVEATQPVASDHRSPREQPTPPAGTGPPSREDRTTAPAVRSLQSAAVN